MREAAQAALHEAVGEARGRLGAPVEERVAAGLVADEAVHRPGAILHADAVVVAGLAAVLEVVPLRQKGAEDAVLHVKERHVLMQREFKLRPAAASAAGRRAAAR